MFENIDLSRVLPDLVDWFNQQLLAPETLYQTVMILVAYAFAGFAYRVFRKRITDAIDHTEMPIRVKRTLNNLKKLIVPLITLTVLFLFTLIAASPYFTDPLVVSLSTAVMKLLLAWIVIRIAVQFFANTAVRNFFAITTLIIAALSIFGVLDETTTALDSVAFSIGKFRLSALAVIKSFLSIVILLYLATFSSTFAERRVLKSKSLTRSSQVLIAKIIRITLITFALLIGVTSAGIDLSIFAVFSGAVGLGVGFGLQKVVSNLFSGLLLLLDKSITPGDVIELEDSATFGWVRHMGARYTEIITRDNKSYLIPNEDFITQRVVNWSHGDRLIRIQNEFGVHYDSDPHEVIRVAIEAATRPDRVVETPPPVCWLTEFGDSSINFSVRFWIKDAEEGVTNVQGQVMLALWDAFKENDIDIPYPHREVFIHEVPTKKAKPAPKKKSDKAKD